MTIWYAPEFKRDYKKLPDEVKEALKARGLLFQGHPFHPLLKTHKLAGALDGVFAFTVDFRHRVLFRFMGKDVVMLLRVGDHSVYRRR